MRAIILPSAAIAVLLCLAACAPKDDPAARVTSPDHALDAVTAERQTDATVGDIKTVYLVPRGEGVSGKPVFLADRVEGLTVQWQDADHLTVHAAAARIFQSYSPADVESAGQTRRVWIRFDIDKMLTQ